MGTPTRKFSLSYVYQRIFLTSSETRRELDRIRSRQYYAAHKDAVRTRILEHAHGKRRQLDEGI